VTSIECKTSISAVLTVMNGRRLSHGQIKELIFKRTCIALWDFIYDLLPPFINIMSCHLCFAVCFIT
jgi:hypothetical protein